MNENELYVVKEYTFDNPLITDIDSILDSCFRDCHTEYSQIFKYECICFIKLTNINNKGTTNFIISGESLILYELNKKLKNARQKDFMFNQINKLTKKFY